MIKKKEIIDDKQERIIRKVWVNVANNKQMLISIPKNQGVKKGDYVEVIKI